MNKIETREKQEYIQKQEARLKAEYRRVEF